MLRTYFASALCLLVAWPAATRAGPAQATRIYRQFCAELDFAHKIFAMGLNGRKKLEDCIFTRKKSVGQCVTSLGVGKGIVKYVRKNAGNFRVSGDALSGFVLQVSDGRLEEIKKQAPKSRYAELIWLRLKIQEFGQELGTQKNDEILPKHLQDGKDAPAGATPENLMKAHKRYVELLEGQLKEEGDTRIQECLLRELGTYAKLVTRGD